MIEILTDTYVLLTLVVKKIRLKLIYCLQNLPLSVSVLQNGSILGNVSHFMQLSGVNRIQGQAKQNCFQQLLLKFSKQIQVLVCTH